MPLFIFAAVLLVALDQAVKYWAFTVLQAQGTLPLIENVFHLTYVENRGAAFSLLSAQNWPWLFVVLAAVITIVAFVALYKGWLQTALGRWSVVLIVAGAVGNAVDRIWHGFVVDLFDFRLIGFPVFNVADIFICVGGVLFVLYFMVQHKDAPKETETEPNRHE